jgi:hypothetical protein
VTDANHGPLQTLSLPKKSSERFLQPKTIQKQFYWLMPGDVVVDTNRHYWIRKREVDGTRHLQAICATESQTFVSVFVPEDHPDTHYRLMLRGLKFSCPIEGYSTSTVKNPLKWEVLSWAERQRSTELEV